jgi:hypothetical protein
MRARQRIPTIFSIYMVDVLCCALGCVILLWLINFRDAKQRTQAASETGQRLSETRVVLDAAQSELAGLRSEISAAHKRERNLSARLNDTEMAREATDRLLRQARKEQADTRLALGLSERQVAALRREIKEVEARSVETSEKLALKAAELVRLMKKLAAVERKSLELSSALAGKTRQLKDADAAAALLASELVDLKKLGDDYKSKLSLAESRARLLEEDLLKSKKEVRDARKLYDDTARAREMLAKRLLASNKDLKSAQGNLVDVEKELKAKLTDAEARARLLEEGAAKGKKDLLETKKLYDDMLSSQDALSRRLALNAKELKNAQAVVASLKDEKLSLAEQARLIRQAAERRFAGINLTGKNVLFLVDMSGSMDLTDENTADPDKWPLVCETVARIMESLADLRQYQVILFSDRVRYPFGKEGSWIRYDPETSAKTVLRGLKAIKPKGETNMASVFDEAFRFRADGLDTIYILSDGLPNAGPGLPVAAQNLSETQKTEILSKYVRNRLKYVLNRPAAGQPRVRINAIGFFFESPDVGAFLWALAREHEGSFVGMSK